jgi:hypothetical protein
VKYAEQQLVVDNGPSGEALCDAVCEAVCDAVGEPVSTQGVLLLWGLP